MEESDGEEKTTSRKRKVEEGIGNETKRRKILSFRPQELIDLTVDETEKENEGDQQTEESTEGRNTQKEEHKNSEVQKERDPNWLSIAASQIAGITGFNPHTEILELSQRYVYQNQTQLLYEDAQALGMIVETPDEGLSRIAALSGKEDLIKEILRKADSAIEVKSSSDVQVLEKDVIQMITGARSKGTLSREEAEWLQKQLCTRLKTGYGSRQESCVLSEYEKKTGTTVYSRNEDLFTITIYDDEESQEKKPEERKTPQHTEKGSSGMNENEPIELDSETSKASPLVNSPKEKGDLTEVMLSTGEQVTSPSSDFQEEEGSGDKESEAEPENLENDKTAEKEQPVLCYLCGKIDGLADIVVNLSDPPEDWESERVVVEVKNRVNRIFPVLPLYDVIQTSVYMHMLGLKSADLVQCILEKKKGGEKEEKEGKEKGKEKGKEEEKEEEKEEKGEGEKEKEIIMIKKLQIDRINFDGVHYEGFMKVILPRVKQFARMIHLFRQTPFLRRRLLSLSPTDQLEFLTEFLPYLSDAPLLVRNLS